MKHWWARPILLFAVLLIALILSWQAPVQASTALYQLPTGKIATVTGSPVPPMAVVVPGNDPQANLRSGPNALFDRVGVLLVGQSVPAIGKSPGGDWIQVMYPGAPGGKAWVYEPLVRIEPEFTVLPIVEPPPSPTPPPAGTIDPTLAARFVVTEEPTRLPTFTAPPPLAIPTFTQEAGPQVGGLPMGMIIVGLAALGLFLGLVAFSQR